MLQNGFLRHRDWEHTNASEKFLVRLYIGGEGGYREVHPSPELEHRKLLLYQKILLSSRFPYHLHLKHD